MVFWRLWCRVWVWWGCGCPRALLCWEMGSAWQPQAAGQCLMHSPCQRNKSWPGWHHVGVLRALCWGCCERVLCILHPKMNYLGECLPCCAWSVHRQLQGITMALIPLPGAARSRAELHCWVLLGIVVSKKSFKCCLCSAGVGGCLHSWVISIWLFM